MRLIKTQTKSKFSDKDAENMIDEVADLYNNDIVWEEDNIEYSYKPNRVFIYINCSDDELLVLKEEYNSIRLSKLFNKRISTYRNYKHVGQTTSGQFTLLKQSSGDLDLNIYYKLKGNNKSNHDILYGFNCIISNNPNWFQFTNKSKQFTPNKTLMTDGILYTSLSLIVIDIEHKYDEFKCIGLPKSKNNVTICDSIIHLKNLNVNINELIYNKLNKRYCAFPDISNIQLVPDDYVKYNICYMAELGSSLTIFNNNDDGLCGLCHVTLFDTYYRVGKNKQMTDMCHCCAVEFTIHYYYQQISITPMESKITSDMMLDKFDFDKHAHIIINQLKLNIRQKITINNINAIDFGNNIIGVNYLFMNQMIAQNIEKLPENTIIFSYYESMN